MSREEFMMKVLENPESLTEAEIHAAIRKGVIANKLNPVLCGTAFKNKGVQQLLDAIVNWMPSPLDRGAIKGFNIDTDQPMELQPSDDSPFAALAFKIMTDPYVGRLTFVRIYSGRLEKGTPFTIQLKIKERESLACLKCTPTSEKIAMSSTLAILQLASA